jgi:hypothetical protein
MLAYKNLNKSLTIMTTLTIQKCAALTIFNNGSAKFPQVIFFPDDDAKIFRGFNNLE